MTVNRLIVVLGWDSSAARAVANMLDLGMEVAVVHRDVRADWQEGILAVTGTPDDPENLRQAGIERAIGILVCLSAEEAGRAIAAARSLNSRIHVVAAIQGNDSKRSLLTAGAHSVIDVREEVALEMVRIMLREPPSSM